MPFSCGIKCQIVSRTDFGIFPEFPHPDSSHFTNRNSPDPFDADKIEIANTAGDGDAKTNISPLKSEMESKADLCLGKETAASVYIPTTPGTRFWLRCKIKEALQECSFYYFKLLMNGRELTSWGIPAEEGYDGQITRAFFDPTDEHVYSDARTGRLYKSMGLERRAFYFAEDTGNSIATDGGLIELRVFRSSGRVRRVQEPAIYKCQEAYGILLNSGGLLDDPHLAKFYEWMLIDPINKPYTVFRFHYRSWDSLITMALVPEDHSRKLDPVTPGILALYGLSVELQEQLDQRHFNKFVGNLKPYRTSKKPLETRVPLTAQALENVPIHEILRIRLRVRARVMNLPEEGEELSNIATDGSEPSGLEGQFTAEPITSTPGDRNNRVVIHPPKLQQILNKCVLNKKVSRLSTNPCKFEDGYVADGYMIDSSSSSESESEFNPEDMGTQAQHSAQDQKHESGSETIDTPGKLESMKDISRALSAEFRQFQGKDQGEGHYEESPESTSERKQAKMARRPSTPYKYHSGFDDSSMTNLDLAVPPAKCHPLTKAKNFLGISTSQNHESDSDFDSYSDSRIDLYRGLPLPKPGALAKAKNFFGVGKSEKARGKEKEFFVPYELDEVAPKKSPVLPFRPQMDHFAETPPEKMPARPLTPVNGILANTPPSLLKSPEEIVGSQVNRPDILSWLEDQPGHIALEDGSAKIEHHRPSPLRSEAKGLRSIQSVARPLPVIPTRVVSSMAGTPGADLFSSASTRPKISNVDGHHLHDSVAGSSSDRLAGEKLGHHDRSRAGSQISSNIGSAHATGGMSCVDASTNFFSNGCSTFEDTVMIDRRDAIASPAPSDASTAPAVRALPTPPTAFTTRAVRALPVLPIIPTAPLNIIHSRDIPIPSIELSPSPVIFHTSKFNTEYPADKTSSLSSTEPAKEHKTLPAIPPFSARKPVPNASSQDSTIRPHRSSSTRDSTGAASTSGTPSKRPERQRGFRGSLDVFTKKLKGLKKDG